MKPIRSDGTEFKPTDLILRSRAKHGVLKDGPWQDLACGRPSRRAQSKSAAADFDTIDCRSQAGLTSVRAPQDEVDDDIEMIQSSETTCCAVITA
jgi:hypothetical protein